MASLPQDDPRNVLDRIARSILVCPCHEGAARDFSELNETDQNQVWDDLTGDESKQRVFQGGREIFPFAEQAEPRPMVDEALHILDLEIHKLQASSKRGLDKVMLSSPGYANDRAFRLKFLRAEKFDPQAAAVRMAMYFDIKLELFGEDKLGREIELSDLDEDDLYSLNLGHFQVLRSADESGRRVLFFYKALTNCYRKRENIVCILEANLLYECVVAVCNVSSLIFSPLPRQVRAVWYLINLISQHESVQKLGVVSVVYNLGGFPESGMDYEKSRRFSKACRAVPIRFVSLLVCLDDAAWLNAVEVFSLMVNKFLRIRMRSIIGTWLSLLCLCIISSYQHQAKRLHLPSLKPKVLT
jgi:hypothetical protein